MYLIKMFCWLFLSGFDYRYKPKDEAWPATSITRFEHCCNSYWWGTTIRSRLQNNESTNSNNVSIATEWNEALLFECDFLWITNPLDVFNSDRSNYDMVFIANSLLPYTINGGFIYIFPTNKAKAVLSKPNNMMQKLGETIKNHRIWKLQSPFENDKFYLSKLVYDRVAGIHTILLRLTYFEDGKWYCYSKKLSA